MTDEETHAIKGRVLRFEPAIDFQATDAATYSRLTAMTFDARALLAEVERLRAALDVIQGQRRRALGILYQIYDLGIDPKNAHTSASVRALLDAAKDVRLD